MKDAEFENKLRERLGEDSTPLDLEMEWADFEARRGKKSRRPFPFLWWGSAFLLLGAIGWGIASFVGQEESDLTTVYTDTIEKEHTNSTVSTPTEKAAAERTIVNAENQNGLLPIKERNVVAETLNNNKNTFNEIVQETEIAQKTILKKGQVISKNKAAFQVNSGQEETVSPRQKKGVADIIANIGEESKFELIDKESTTKESEADNIGIVENSLEINSLIVQQDLDALLLPTRMINIPALASVDPLSSFGITPAVVPVEKHSKWRLGIQGNLGQSFRNLEATNTDSENSTFVQLRNDSEKPLEVWSTSISLARRINKNWFAELIFGYSRTTDRFTNTTVTTEDELLDSEVTGIINKASGEKEFLYGQVLATNTTTTKGTYFQTDQQGFVQLSAGRYLPIYKQFGLALSTGLQYGFYVKKDGPVSDSRNLMLLDDLKNSNFKNNGLWNASVQVSAYYRLNQTWECTVGLRGSSSLNNAFDSRTDISEKRKSIVGVLGVSRWF